MHVKRKFDVDRFHKRLLRGEVSRREINAAFAGAGLASVSLPMGQSARANDGRGDEITYFTWSGYDIPELFET